MGETPGPLEAPLSPRLDFLKCTLKLFAHPNHSLESRFLQEKEAQASQETPGMQSGPGSLISHQLHYPRKDKARIRRGTVTRPCNEALLMSSPRDTGGSAGPCLLLLCLGDEDTVRAKSEGSCGLLKVLQGFQVVLGVSAGGCQDKMWAPEAARADGTLSQPGGLSWAGEGDLAHHGGT